MSAIIFDLDDTLHRERRWLLSGLAAAASQVAERWCLERSDVFRFLVRAVRAGHRDHVLQLMCHHFQLPEELVPDLVTTIRTHKPALRLGHETRRVLCGLRATWRLGVLTNGHPAVQARKVAALGLTSMVDSVVYADLYGSKPTYLPFLMVAERLGTEPSRCVFVGDDPWCDVYGAQRVGMRTVQVVRGSTPTPRVGPQPDAVIGRLSDVGDAAVRVMRGETDDVVDDLRACS